MTGKSALLRIRRTYRDCFSEPHKLYDNFPCKEEELPYVTYCVNCRESFAGQGKEAVHILDLLFLG